MKQANSKFYRQVTLEQLAGAKLREGVALNTVDAVAQHLLKHGPVRIRARWHTHMMNVNASNGRIDVVGNKIGRQTCALVGYDGGEEYPFRMLTPFGSAFGQLGRVWISRDGLAKLLKEGAKVDAPIV